MDVPARRRTYCRALGAVMVLTALLACAAPPRPGAPAAELAGEQPGLGGVEAGSDPEVASLRETAPGAEVVGALPPPRPTPYGFASGAEVIGTSVEGRPLEIHRFGYGPLGRFVSAGIHGGYEWNTSALARELIDYLEAHPGVVPTDVTLYILPVINPDGEARSHGFDGRANANGVDLGRNWNANWAPDWPRSGCWRYRPITGGRYPASEPEVAALMGYLLEHPVDALLNYHSAALGVFPGGDPPLEDSVELAELVSEVSGYPYPPIDTGCEFTGQFTDWLALQGVASVDVELTNHRDTDFEINLRVLRAFLTWRR